MTPLTNLGPGKGDALTTRPSMLKAVAAGVEVMPFLTTGDKIGDFQFAGTPDGMGALDNGDGTYTLLVNHEWTFSANIADAMVSRLIVDKKTMHVTAGDYLIKGTEGYKRFCSATLVGKDAGFDAPVFLTNEEATDGKHGGVVVAVDPNSGKVTDLPQLGYFPHENTTAVPYKGKVVLILGDDNWPGELYMYVANNSADVLAGKGQLYVLKAGDKDGKPIQFENQLKKGDSIPVTFVPVSQDDNKNVKSLATAAEKLGAFKFVRIEDSEYDRNDPTTVWFTTTGRSQATDPDTKKPYDAKGALWNVQLDPGDPTKATLSLVLSGDQGDDILNPDNVATSQNSVIMLEDINDEFRGGHPGRVLRYDFKTKTVTPIAELVQKDFDGKDIPGDKAGEWESSGIINTFDLLGQGTWIINVQAHTLKTEQLGRKDEGGQLLIIKASGS
jgi:secreted PhoX family phosphatase